VLAPERERLILRLLRQDRFATVSELAGLAEASEATVRRDLDRLERTGQLVRVRGGAELAAGAEEGTAQLPFESRIGLMGETKRRIAHLAASLCSEQDTVIIDGGSTTYHMAEFLLPMKLQILTNSFALAQALVGRSTNTVILSGGVVHADSQLVLDPFQEDPFRYYVAAKVFMGVYGIDEMGATNTEVQLIHAERAMIERAKELIILADSSKFGRRGSLFLCGFERIHTVISDAGVSEDQRRLLESRGVKLLIV
jgi:DeoR family ulaG and ulaABCDEF operon transcriptional repressor